MKEFLTILLIGMALSMDAFSIAISIGTLDLKRKKEIVLSLIVGIMHFLMPFIGLNIGLIIIKGYNLKASFFAGLILVVLAIKSILEILKNPKKEINLNVIGIILFSISVSVDAFSTGVGLKGITYNYWLSFIVFSLCSSSFTYLGLIIGKYIKNKINISATIIGILILLILGIFYMCK